VAESHADGADYDTVLFIERCAIPIAEDLFQTKNSASIGMVFNAQIIGSLGSYLNLLASMAFHLSAARVWAGVMDCHKVRNGRFSFA